MRLPFIHHIRRCVSKTGDTRKLCKIYLASVTIISAWLKNTTNELNVLKLNIAFPLISNDKSMSTHVVGGAFARKCFTLAYLRFDVAFL